jgi:hypothetical protein
MNRHSRFTGACAGILLVTAFAASCAESPSQPAQPRITAKLEIVSGQGQIGGPGEELPTPLTVRAVDSAGLPVSGQIVNFRVVQGGGSVFAGANVTGADGIAREYWTLGPKAGEAQVLEARAVDNATSQKIVFGTFTATSVGSRPNRIDFFLPTEWAVATTYQYPVEAYVRDEFLNPVVNVPVTFTVIQGNARLTSPAGQTASTITVNTGADGKATIRFTTGTVAGTNTVRVTAGTVVVERSTLGTPGSPKRVEIQPGALTVPVGGSANVEAWGYDRFNNKVSYKPSWSTLDPSIVTVVSPTQTSTVATVQGNAQGTGRVIARIQLGTSILLADTINVTVQ